MVKTAMKPIRGLWANLDRGAGGSYWDWTVLTPITFILWDGSSDGLPNYQQNQGKPLDPGQFFLCKSNWSEGETGPLITHSTSGEA